MADQEIVIEMAPQKNTKRFYQTRKFLLATAVICIILACALFSWWLSLGKISSVAGRVDGLVYTVGPETAAQTDAVLVNQGEAVAPGQPLAKITLLDSNVKEAQQPIQNQEPQESTLITRLQQAQDAEEKARRAHQEAVSDHVRAQLGMRAINRNNQLAYTQASEIEFQARRRMQMALEEFEKANKYRASVEQNLRRMQRAKVMARTGAKVQTTAPVMPASKQTTDLVAPAAGTILAVHASPGQNLGAGQAIFFILPSERTTPNDRWVQAWFPLADKDRLEVGQKAAVKIGEQHFTGKIEEIAPDEQPLPQESANASSGEIKLYVPVKISFADAEKPLNLTPGQQAECQIQTRYGMDWLF